MFSMVLFVAITAGGESVDFGKKGGCTGSCTGGRSGGLFSGGLFKKKHGGCSGVVYGGCSGTPTYSAPVYGGGCSGMTYGTPTYSAPVYGGGCSGVVPGTIVYGGCGAVIPGTIIGGGCTGGTIVTPPTGGKVIEENKPKEEKKGGKTIEGTGKGKDENPKTEKPPVDDKAKKGSALNAAETKWLSEMVSAEKDADAKKETEAEFKAESRLGRKAMYDLFVKMKKGEK